VPFVFRVFCKLLGSGGGFPPPPPRIKCQVNLQGAITDMFPWSVVFCERQAAETKSWGEGEVPESPQHVQCAPAPVNWLSVPQEDRGSLPPSFASIRISRIKPNLFPYGI